MIVIILLHPFDAKQIYIFKDVKRKSKISSFDLIDFYIEQRLFTLQHIAKAFIFINSIVHSCLLNNFVATSYVKSPFM